MAFSTPDRAWPATQALHSRPRPSGGGIGALEPLVSIGIPTYNRARSLRRSIESALRQDFPNLEILISDNASTDETAEVCQSYCAQDRRIRYTRQSRNRGPTENFSEVLKGATGTFFMWLGDDDWIDVAYVRTCVRHMLADPSLALISGVPRYYRDGELAGDGKVLCLLHDDWRRRVISYYMGVSDNGIFYGLMRTEDIRKITLQNTLGGDWLLMASVACLGKARMVSDVAVHRQLGGATASYQHLATSLGLRASQARFPMLSVASSALIDIVATGDVYERRSRLARLVVGCVAFVVIATKPAVFHLQQAARRMKQLFTGRS
jgi:glycosyl transferase family 2